MKLYKSLFIATALLGGMLASCSEDGVWDQASQQNMWLTNGTSYAFDNTTINYTYYPADVMKDMDVNVTITRGTTEGTIEIPIANTFSDDELISGPASVTFQDGSNTAVYPIHVKQEFEPGVAATAKLVIDSTKVGIPTVEMPKKLQPGATAEDSAKFLADSILHAAYVKKLAAYKLSTTVTIEKDYNWESLGTGKYYDRFTWGSTYYEAEIQQAVEDKSWYRVVDPYTQALEDYELTVKDGPSKFVKVKVLKPGDVVRGTTVTMKDLVYFPDIKTGEYSEDYGAEINAFHPSKFTSLADESNWTYSTVASYQKDGTPAQILLAPYYYMYGVGGWNYTQQVGRISIVFPGVKIYNYSASIEYAGLFTHPDNTVYVLADYELSGADAKKAKTYKVAVISQDDDAEAVADAILAGDYPASDLEDVLKNDRIQIAMPEGLTGKLQVILVIIDSSEEGTADEVKNVVGAPFEYYGGADPWKSLGKATYYEDFIGSVFGIGVRSYEVEIQENSQASGIYRLVNPYENYPENGEGDYTPGSSFNIEINASDPEGVYITKQPIGMDWGYGDMYIQTQGSYYLDNNNSYEDIKAAGWFGTLENKVITFPYGNRTAQDGSQIPFQGWLWMGSSRYYAGANQSIAIVLPGANLSSAAKRALEKNLNANSFERRLNAVPSMKVSNNDLRSSKLIQSIK